MLKGFYMTLLIGAGVPMPPPREVIDAVQSVQITSGGVRGGFQVAFAAGKSSIIARALVPSGYFDPGVRVIVVATVGGIPHVLMDGLITRHEVSPSNVASPSTFTITGEDLSLAMDIIELPDMRYPGMNEQAAVATILGRYAFLGIVPAVIPPIFGDSPSPTAEIHTQTGTDWQHIQRMCARVGHVFFLEPGPAPGMSIGYWGPDIRVPVPQPALSTDMDAHTNVESLTFSFNGLEKKIVVLRIFDPEEEKNVIPIPVPNISPLRPPLGARMQAPMKLEYLDFASKLKPIRAAAYAMATTVRATDSVTANGEINVMRYGRVLRARQVVGVRGAGLAYDGLYYVQSVTHNLRRGEYKQSFTLARDGLVSMTPMVPV